MYEHPDLEDNHNAPVFRWCYKRMGEFIPQLLEEGRQPRVMLEYSGTLLHGLRQMGADDVLETVRPDLREWLGEDGVDEYLAVEATQQRLQIGAARRMHPHPCAVTTCIRPPRRRS